MSSFYTTMALVPRNWTWCAQSIAEKWIQRQEEPVSSLKSHPSLSGGGGDQEDKRGLFSCWGLMVSFWRLISDPCYMNSSQLEFIAPHWFLLAPILHRSCLYLFEVWCILKQNEPDFPYCLCQCLVMENINSFTTRILTSVVHPSYAGRPKGDGSGAGRVLQVSLFQSKGQIFHHLHSFWNPSISIRSQFTGFKTARVMSSSNYMPTNWTI